MTGGIILAAVLRISGVVWGVIAFTPSGLLDPPAQTFEAPTPFPTVTPRPILHLPDDVIDRLKEQLEAAPAARVGWEYLAMEKRPGEMVDTLGEQPRWLRKVGLDGWELISVSDPTPHYDGGPTYVTLLFKRAK